MVQAAADQRQNIRSRAARQAVTRSRRRRRRIYSGAGGGCDNRVVASGETHNAWRGWWRHIRSGLIDNLLHRRRCEDGIALIRAEGEAASDDGVLPASAGNLKRRAEIA